MSSKIQHKLYNYEQTPPVSVWAKISSALENEIKTNDIGSKLYDVEVMPPATAWNKIGNALNEPVQRRVVPFLRYAAAAAIIGLLTWGGLQLINSNKTKSDVVVNKPEIKNNIEPVINPPVIKDDQPVAHAESEDERNEKALEQSKKTYAKLDISKKKKINIVSGFHFSGFTSADAIPSAEPIRDRYIVLMNPDGNFIRVSKKLSNMVCCVSGEEQDADCKDQMEKWRKQLACSSASHPGNFLDILSLVSSLQD